MSSELWQFDTLSIGRRTLVFDELASTNSTAAAMDDAEHGLAIVARHQTSGRGRFGRIWQSRPGSSLLLSVVLKPPPELRRAAILTATAAVAVGDAVYALTETQARIKWPNDLLVRGKKVCGILIEQGRAVVVGIGLNLNQTAEDFRAAELRDATSLAVICGSGIELHAAASAILHSLDTEYSRLLGGERVAVEADWKWRTGLLGRPVRVELVGGEVICGRLLEMSFDALEVEVPDRGVRAIVPETVEHIYAALSDPPAPASGRRESV